MSGWQPIETAPKDGTDILGYDSAAKAFLEVFYDTKDDGVFRLSWNFERNYEISHWMPLPAPPEPKDDMTQ